MRLSLIWISLCAAGALHAQLAIVNGDSYRADQPVAPGGFVSAFGTFTGIQTTIQPTLPFPKTLGGVGVKVDGVDAALIGVTPGPPGQINFFIPYATAPGVRPVVVTLPGGTTISGSVKVSTTGPAINIQDASVTPPRGAVLNQDYSINMQNAPAHRGDFIQIFGSGPGALSQSLDDGAPAPASPLITTKSKPQVFIGGIEVNPSDISSAISPGSVRWQVNAKVPAQSFISGRVPLQIFMDGVDSNEVAIFVAP